MAVMAPSNPRTRTGGRMSNGSKLTMSGVLVIALLVLSLKGESARAADAKKKDQQEQQATKNEFPKEWFWGEPEQRQKQDELLGKPMPNLALSGWMNGA